MTIRLCQAKCFLEYEVSMAIILDAMGSDEYPVPEILASMELVNQEEKVILVGKKDLILEKLKNLNITDFSTLIVDAPDIVEMTDKPVESFRQKPNNSMAVGLRMVQQGEGDAFVTAGNTGAAAFNAITILRRLPGISRPALAAIIPTKNKKCVFMDTGVNADCRPDFLLEFAVLGSVYASKVLGIPSPKVGLLSIGEEPEKGSQLVKDAFKLLQSSNLNFYGNVEPKEVFASFVDVVVTDGFSGNVFIKSSEAVGKLVSETLKTNITKSFLSKLGYLLAKPAFLSLKRMMDPSETGAAILLGVNGLAFIGHGRSDSKALVSAVKLARKSIDNNLLSEIKTQVQASLPTNQPFSLN
jgi:glycerol-3-phosphate acyltransferase PlsX